MFPPEKNKELINSRGPSKNFMWFHLKQGNNILGASNARILAKEAMHTRHGGAPR